MFFAELRERSGSLDGASYELRGQQTFIAELSGVNAVQHHVQALPFTLQRKYVLSRERILNRTNFRCNRSTILTCPAPPPPTTTTTASFAPSLLAMPRTRRVAPASDGEEEEAGGERTRTSPSPLRVTSNTLKYEQKRVG